MRINEIAIVNEDWQKTNKKDKTDGMSRKAVKAYRRENPGSKLKTAVTTKPSKLKKGSKSAKRRKSFCARMSGMKKSRASAKTKRDPDSPINKALRRWNCESVEQLHKLMMIAEHKVKLLREAANPAQQAAIAISMKKKGQKPKQESAIEKGLVDEGWKEKLGAAALAGSMALGAAGANARVVPGQDDPSINRLTGKPIATQQATDTAPTKAGAPSGYSKEWLQKAADPNRIGRYMISVEKAQELLKNMP